LQVVLVAGFAANVANVNEPLFSGVSKDDTMSNTSTCHSPASSEAGGIYPPELVENFALNLHR
jgi:hypothetical protein